MATLRENQRLTGEPTDLSSHRRERRPVCLAGFLFHVRASTLSPAVSIRRSWWFLDFHFLPLIYSHIRLLHSSLDTQSFHLQTRG